MGGDPPGRPVTQAGRVPPGFQRTPEHSFHLRLKEKPFPALLSHHAPLRVLLPKTVIFGNSGKREPPGVGSGTAIDHILYHRDDNGHITGSEKVCRPQTCLAL